MRILTESKIGQPANDPACHLNATAQQVDNVDCTYFLGISALTLLSLLADQAFQCPPGLSKRDTMLEKSRFGGAN